MRKFKLKPGVLMVLIYGHKIEPGMIVEDDRLAGHMFLEEVFNSAPIMSNGDSVNVVSSESDPEQQSGAPEPDLTSKSDVGSEPDLTPKPDSSSESAPMEESESTKLRWDDSPGGFTQEEPQPEEQTPEEPAPSSEDKPEPPKPRRHRKKVEPKPE